MIVARATAFRGVDVPLDAAHPLWHGRRMPSADYVIVGAGSAGCVLANRLSEEPSDRMLLLEAGGKGRHPNISIPAAFAKQFHTKLDWDLATEPEPHCAERNPLPAARQGPRRLELRERDALRPRPPARLPPLASPGRRGLGVAGRAALLKAEHNERGASEHHAVGGPLNVADTRSPRPLTPLFLEAAKTAGIPRGSGLQRPGAGRRLMRAGDAEETGGAGARPTPPAAASEPSGGHGRACAQGRGRGHARRGCALPRQEGGRAAGACRP